MLPWEDGSAGVKERGSNHTFKYTIHIPDERNLNAEKSQGLLPELIVPGLLQYLENDTQHMRAVIIYLIDVA